MPLALLPQLLELCPLLEAILLVHMSLEHGDLILKPRLIVSHLQVSTNRMAEEAMTTYRSILHRTFGCRARVPIWVACKLLVLVSDLMIWNFMVHVVETLLREDLILPVALIVIVPQLVAPHRLMKATLCLRRALFPPR